MPVDYMELIGSPKEWWSPEGHFAAERRLLCNWDERYDLIAELATGGPGGGPQRNPHAPQYECYANSASAAPLDKAKVTEETGLLGLEISDYEKAVVTCNYSTNVPYYAGAGGRNLFLFEEYEANVEVKNIDNSQTQFKWSTSGLAVPQGDMPPMFCFSGVLRQTFFHVNVIPYAARWMRGHVNKYANATWTLGMAFPPHTLLYKGFTVSRTVEMRTVSALRVAYEWWEKYPSWYQEWDPMSAKVSAPPPAAYDYIKNARGEVDWRFPKADFNELIPG